MAVYKTYLFPLKYSLRSLMRLFKKKNIIIQL